MASFSFLNRTVDYRYSQNVENLPNANSSINGPSHHHLRRFPNAFGRNTNLQLLAPYKLILRPQQ